MTELLRQEIEAIYRSAVNGVRADRAVRENVDTGATGELVVCGQTVEIGPAGVYAIAIGKAAVAMIDAAAESIGAPFTAGLAVTKAESASMDSRISVLRGSHPVPDARSLDAGAAVLRFAELAPYNALVLCLISGGGSALVESLRDGVDLSRLQELTSRLLGAGASIHELNAVRSRLSVVKAGGLLRHLSHARVHNLIVSDVLGDDVRTIASGPTVPPIHLDAERVLSAYGIGETIPGLDETQPMGLPPTTVIANLERALDTAAKAAMSLGYRPIVLSRSLDGEARETGRVLGAMLADGVAGKTAFGSQTCLLAGGETTVKVRGGGSGGRNTEAALAAAIRLSGIRGAAIGFLATDGDDASTGAAGAIVDGTSVTEDQRRDALRALDDNDSFTYLKSRHATLVTGPTGTNVNDLVIGLIE